MGWWLIPDYFSAETALKRNHPFPLSPAPKSSPKSIAICVTTTKQTPAHVGLTFVYFFHCFPSLVLLNYKIIRQFPCCWVHINFSFPYESYYPSSHPCVNFTPTEKFLKVTWKELVVYFKNPSHKSRCIVFFLCTPIIMFNSQIIHRKRVTG